MSRTPLTFTASYDKMPRRTNELTQRIVGRCVRKDAGKVGEGWQGMTAGQGDTAASAELQGNAKDARFLTWVAIGDLPPTLDLTPWSGAQLAAMLWFATPAASRIPSTVERLADRLDVDKTTVHRWRKIEGWDDAVTEIARYSLGRHRPNAYGYLLREMAAGDMKALRLYFELLGDIGPEGKGATANVAVQLVIAQDGDGGRDGRRLTVIDGDAERTGDGQTEEERTRVEYE